MLAQTDAKRLTGVEVRGRELLSLWACFITLLLAACEPAPYQDEQVAEASTGTVFDLTPAEMMSLEQKALAGDAHAAFRLSNFYTLAGGEGDPNIDEPHDKEQAIRWLRLADSLGHPTARHNLEFLLADEACASTEGMPDTSVERKAAHRMKKATQGVACDGAWLREIEPD
ncbi:hypothetical protein [Brevundimonas sp.]|uniref:hypothetical protein n=1 Tax=Brevundimonas sp. TaxID=1871086 RepID=UPI00351837EB